MKNPVMPAVLGVVLSCGAVMGSWTLSRAADPVRRPSFSAQRIWVRSVVPNADSAPAYVGHVRVGSQIVAVVYVLAGNNGSNCDPSDPVRQATLYAFRAGSGRVLWTRSTRGPSRCTTAGPVVDPRGHWVYAPGLDGKVHRYNAASGRETSSGGWPYPATLMPDVEKMSATPTISGRYLYATTSGFIGDAGHYEGHLVTIDLVGGGEHVFNSLCSNIRALLVADSGRTNYCSSVQSGLFGRGQGALDPVNRDVYVVSGNGPWNGRTDWGDSIMKLNPSGTRLLDAFTPTNQQDLANNDADLGSSGPAILPAIRHAGHTYHLLVQAGKGPACGSCGGAALRLVNRDRLGGRPGPGHLGGDLADTQTPGGGEVLTAPAVWRASDGHAWDFVANGDGVAGYRVDPIAGGKFHLDRIWLDRPGGTTPVMAQGLLYVASSGHIETLNPRTGAVLWHTSGIGDVHWQYPLVAGNLLVMSDQSGHVTAYRLNR